MQKYERHNKYKNTKKKQNNRYKIWVDKRLKVRHDTKPNVNNIKNKRFISIIKNTKCPIDAQCQKKVKG